LAAQLQAMSEDQKVHSVENDLELMPMLIPVRESPEPRRASSEESTNPKPLQLTVIPLTPLYQRDGPVCTRGDLKKTSSGQEKKIEED